MGDVRVLAVDDSETNRKILMHQIASWGMRGDSAEDGPSALRMLREAAGRGEPYDLAILDMQMPGIDGMELARRIKEDPTIASTRLVMLTSMGGRREEDEMYPDGIAAYLNKPVKQSQLYDALADVLAGVAEGGEQELTAPPPIETSPSAVGTPYRHTDRPHARILVAEDNAINQKVAAKMLERLGYCADVAANGLEAVEALSSIPYRAVLMDVQMPEMDGYGATAEIRRREEGTGHRTPIIAMTANAMTGDREKALGAGMDDYVAKPVEPEELEAVLKCWVSGADQASSDVEEETDDTALPANDVDPLDRSILASLRELQKEDEPDLLNELGELFLEDTLSQLEALRVAVKTGDVHTLKRIPHTLKGCCGNIGAVGMSEISAQLQNIGASKNPRHAPALLRRLEAEFKRVRTALQVEIGGSGG